MTSRDDIDKLVNAYCDRLDGKPDDEIVTAEWIAKLRAAETERLVDNFHGELDAASDIEFFGLQRLSDLRSEIIEWMCEDYEYELRHRQRSKRTS